MVAVKVFGRVDKGGGQGAMHMYRLPAVSTCRDIQLPAARMAVATGQLSRKGPVAGACAAAAAASAGTRCHLLQSPTMYE